MSFTLRRPLIVEVSDDDGRMNEFMDKLEVLGFMPSVGDCGLYPYEAQRDAFYEETGTYPTHFVLLSPDVYSKADGLVCDLCGEEELDALWSDPDVGVTFGEVDAEEFAEILAGW